MSYDLTPSPHNMDVFAESPDIQESGADIREGAASVRDGAAGRMARRTPDDDCWDCCVPPKLETRVLHPPRKCVPIPCNYTIPPMGCPFQCKPHVEVCNPLCFDWHVDAPGPNDSYGLNGLNPHDWKMDGMFADNKNMQLDYHPRHPAFSRTRPDPHHPVAGLVCSLPMECYGRDPGMRPCNYCPFTKDVNYFRDWRCCEAKPPAPWKPPYKQWATGRAA